MDYKPLTKKVIQDNQECVTCALYGTSDCKIHTDKIQGCAECPMLSAIYNQLYEFERVYMEG